jgi:hypothetical protein
MLPGLLWSGAWGKRVYFLSSVLDLIPNAQPAGSSGRLLRQCSLTWQMQKSLNAERPVFKSERPVFKSDYATH